MRGGDDRPDCGSGVVADGPDKVHRPAKRGIDSDLVCPAKHLVQVRIRRTLREFLDFRRPVEPTDLANARVFGLKPEVHTESGHGRKRLASRRLGQEACESRSGEEVRRHSFTGHGEVHDSERGQLDVVHLQRCFDVRTVLGERRRRALLGIAAGQLKSPGLRKGNRGRHAERQSRDGLEVPGQRRIHLRRLPRRGSIRP